VQTARRKCLFIYFYFMDRQFGLIHVKLQTWFPMQIVNPLLKDLLQGYQHYWVTSQSEYSTDIIFKSSADLRELFPRLLSHSTLCFGAKDVMSFLGRKLTGHFLGEILSDAISARSRLGWTIRRRRISWSMAAAMSMCAGEAALLRA
jgi:hypothetical protein